MKEHIREICKASLLASDYQQPHPLPHPSSHHLIVIIDKPNHLFPDFINLIKINLRSYTL